MLFSFNNQKIEVSIEDLIRLEVSGIGIFVGTVEAVSQDYISLKKIVILDLFNESTFIFQDSILFYSDEILNMVVIGGKCNIQPLKQVNVSGKTSI